MTLARLRAWLGAWWGSALLCGFSLLSLVRLELQAMPGHYRVFAGAGHALFAGGNPYGDTFGTGVGYYFYSPACAMLVFGPLSCLPEKLGILVYMGVSLAAFAWGARSFGRAFGASPRLMQWFWALITSQVVLAILASKLELMIAGLLLGSVALLGRAERLDARAWAGLLMLSAILNWKLQPVPVAGLLLLSWLLVRRDWRAPLAFAGCVGFWYALPFAFFGHSYLMNIYGTLQSTLAHFMGEAFLDFENVFAFAHKAFGAPVSLAGSQAVSGACALGTAGYLAAWIRRAKPSPSPMAEAARLSAGLGAAYICAFSPLGQNNALILYAPLLLAALLQLARSPRPALLRAAVAATATVMILAYSDAVPPGLREELRHLSIKAVACLMLGLALMGDAWVDRSREIS